MKKKVNDLLINKNEQTDYEIETLIAQLNNDLQSKWS